jgi:4-hydroxy-tetrahydrodipicolinate reductase
MGRALAAAVDETAGLELVGAGVSPGSRYAGQDVAAILGGVSRGVLAAADPADAIAHAEATIDFTLPEATVGNVAACLSARCPIVIGTTGHDSAAREQIAQAARHIAIVMAPNMSLGVNLLLNLVEQAARALDAAYDIEIFEAHHRNKKDAPSGTALALGEAAARGRGVSLSQKAQYARHGASGAREPGGIGFSVFRGGDVVGDHTVTFAGVGERIELTHRASDRMAFARGAVRAAQWVVGREPGLYSMQDVLGLKRIADSG